MHAEVAAHLGVHDGLDHRTENIGIDFAPIKLGGVDQKPLGAPIEGWHFRTVREKAAIDIGEGVNVSGQIPTLIFWHVHHIENLPQQTLEVFAVRAAKIVHRFDKQVGWKAAGVFREHAEQDAVDY